MAFSHIPNPLPPEGFPLPVDEIRSYFRVLGFLPGRSNNSLSPRLVLHADRLEIKVISTSYYEYTALTRIDYRPDGFLHSERVVLRVDADSTTYEFIPASPAIRRGFLQFCRQRGLTLTPAAQAAAEA